MAGWQVRACFLVPARASFRREGQLRGLPYASGPSNDDGNSSNVGITTTIKTLTTIGKTWKALNERYAREWSRLSVSFPITSTSFFQSVLEFLDGDIWTFRSFVVSADNKCRDFRLLQRIPAKCQPPNTRTYPHSCVGTAVNNSYGANPWHTGKKQKLGMLFGNVATWYELVVVRWCKSLQCCWYDVYNKIPKG